MFHTESQSFAPSYSRAIFFSVFFFCASASLCEIFAYYASFFCENIQIKLASALSRSWDAQILDQGLGDVCQIEMRFGLEGV